MDSSNQSCSCVSGWCFLVNQVGSGLQSLLYVNYFAFMGSCATCRPYQPQDNQCSVDEVPEGTAQLAGRQLPRLTFYLLLSDLKLNQCFEDLVSMRFLVEGAQEFSFPAKKTDINGRSAWKMERSFQIQASEYQFRNSFIQGNVYCKRGFLGRLKLNLFTVWRGPSHLDYCLPLKNSPNCRISFNLRISQAVHFTLESLFVHYVPLLQLAPKNHISVLMVSHISSRVSASALPDLIVGKEEQVIPVAGSRFGPYFKELTEKPTIWESSSLCSQTSILDKVLGLYNISQSSVSLQFMQVAPQCYDTIVENASFCKISLSKLIDTPFTLRTNELTYIEYQDHCIELHESTWREGKSIGKVTLGFHLSIQSHYQQMHTGVRTEAGIMKSSFSFLSPALETKTYQDLLVIKRLLQSAQAEFFQNESGNGMNYAMSKGSTHKLVGCFSKMKGILEKTTKQSTIIFEYPSQKSLYQGQQLLIDLCFKVMSLGKYLPAEAYESREHIKIAILRREELQLSNVGFKEDEKSRVINRALNEETGIKLRITLKFQRLLIELLQQTLKSLEMKGEGVEQQQFVLFICSYIYFRIPSFAKAVLQALDSTCIFEKSEAFQPLAYLSSRRDLKSREQNRIDLLYFDWSNNFHKIIEGESESMQNQERLQAILMGGSWRKIFADKNAFFVTFLWNLISEVEYVSKGSKHIQWNLLLGYPRLISAFLKQMEKMSVKDYGRGLKRCCIKLLSNAELIGPFVTILYNSTNLYNSQSVQITFELINDFLAAVKVRGRMIPNSLDLHLFARGLTIVLESECQYSICYVLLVILHHLPLFPFDFRFEMCIYLMGSVFYRLFYHWSKDLRHIFHTIFQIRIKSIYRQAQQEAGDEEYESCIKFILKQRYQKIISLLKESENEGVERWKNSLYGGDSVLQRMKTNLAKKKSMVNKKNSFNLPLLKSSTQTSHSIQSQSTQSLGGITFNFYFKPSQLLLGFPSELDLRHSHVSLQELRDLQVLIERNIKYDPQYIPEIKLKKLIDEKEAL